MRLLLVLQALAVNAVAAVGVFARHWTIGTALSLYWWESAILFVLISLRLVLHRRLTGQDDGTTVPMFVLGIFAWLSASGMILWFIMAAMFPKFAPHEVVDPHALKLGVLAIAAVLTLGFLFDLPALRKTPLEAMSAMADSYTPRVIVLQLAIMFGALGLLKLHSPHVMFAILVIGKTIAEVNQARRKPEVAEVVA